MLAADVSTSAAEPACEATSFCFRSRSRCFRLTFFSARSLRVVSDFSVVMAFSYSTRAASRFALAEARASLRSAQAALQSAQLDLDYTQVRAPVSGRIGKIEVTPKVAIRTRDDISMSYTPGVALVSSAIHEDHE